MHRRTIFIVIGIILIIIASATIIAFRPKGNQETINLAKCLTEKGYSLAGTDWCPHCNEQKEMFASAFKYITYYNCDIEEEWCSENTIQSYPSWVSPTGAVSPGKKSIAILKQISGCD